MLEGRSILSVPSNKRNIGMVFQRYTLFPHLSVAENVAFPLRVRRQSRAEIDAKVAAMLRLVRLDRFADRKPAQLSGGQQQRVALARALAYDPPLLLMDEPLSALDKKLREEIQYEIKRIHTETGVTILYVTHDQEEALRLSDRIALFNQGRIEQIGSGRDLYETPRTRFVAGFIGNSNFIRACVTKRMGESGQVSCPDGSTVDGVSLADLPAGEKDALIMIRPDRIQLAKSSSGGTGLSGRVTSATFLGESLHVSVETPWGEAIDVRSSLDVPETRDLTPGDWVNVRFKSDDVRVFSPNT